MSSEKKYLDLLAEVYQDGEWRSDRTGTGVSSLFGKQVVYDLKDEDGPLVVKNSFQ